LDISENDIGFKNFLILLDIFKSNTQIETLNVADCTLDGDCASKLCSILEEKNMALKLLKFRNSNLGEEGAQAIANLIGGH
jgi:Ran GTPase-activating protein (RanGAP) involved in mRNA processing and transport